MIRIYQDSDLDDLLQVWTAASSIAHSFLSEEFQKQELYNIPNVYLPNAETWVWEVDGRVLGFMALIGREVGALFVDPDSQRSGIGRALVDKAKELRGTLEVEVFEKNEIGRAFYDGYGFELVRKKIHPESGFETLRLKLTDF